MNSKLLEAMELDKNTLGVPVNHSGRFDKIMSVDGVAQLRVEQDYERDTEGRLIPIPSLEPRKTRVEHVVQMFTNLIYDLATFIRNHYYRFTSWNDTHKVGYLSFGIYFHRRTHCMPCSSRFIDVETQLDFCGAVNEGKSCGCGNKKGASLDSVLPLALFQCPLNKFGIGNEVQPPDWMKQYMPSVIDNDNSCEKDS